MQRKKTKEEKKGLNQDSAGGIKVSPWSELGFDEDMTKSLISMVNSLDQNLYERKIPTQEEVELADLKVNLSALRLKERVARGDIAESQRLIKAEAKISGCSFEIQLNPDSSLYSTLKNNPLFEKYLKADSDKEQMLSFELSAETFQEISQLAGLLIKSFSSHKVENEKSGGQAQVSKQGVFSESNANANKNLTQVVDFFSELTGISGWKVNQKKGLVLWIDSENQTDDHFQKAYQTLLQFNQQHQLGMEIKYGVRGDQRALKMMQCFNVNIQALLPLMASEKKNTLTT